MALVSRVLEKEPRGMDMMVTVRVSSLSYFKTLDMAEKKAKARALFEAGVISNNSVLDMGRLSNPRSIVQVEEIDNVSKSNRGVHTSDFTVRVKG